MSDGDRERIVRLEVRLDHMEEKLDDTHKKVAEMHELLLRARGARWLIVSIAATAGFVSSFLPKALPFFNGMPK